jgi:hypothetical protein
MMTSIFLLSWKQSQIHIKEYNTKLKYNWIIHVAVKMYQFGRFATLSSCSQQLLCGYRMSSLRALCNDRSCVCIALFKSSGKSGNAKVATKVPTRGYVVVVVDGNDGMRIAYCIDTVLYGAMVASLSHGHWCLANSN